MFAPTLVMLAIVSPANITSAWGLRQVGFAVPQGKLTVYLPDDMRAGDTISGTVLAEPTGKSDAERAKNADVLEGTVIDVGGRSVRPGSFTLPIAGASALVVSLGGSRASVPVAKTATSPTGGPWVAPVSQVGKPVQVVGSFDGNLSNTAASFGGSPVPVLAESPRSMICMPPRQPLGPVGVSVDEGGQHFDLKTVCAELRLSADRTQLLRGEHANFTVTVAGLSAVPADEFPLSVELTNHSPSVVSMGGVGTCRALAIEAGDVQNGIWTRTLDVTALQSGSYVISGVLFAVNIHALKMTLDADELAALIQASIESAQALLDKKTKDKAPERTINLIKKKIESLQNAKDSLPEQVDVARTIFDKALADFTFFEMAGELIDFAADMLGYKDLPLPGIGHVLKALKVVGKSLPKVVALVEKAEKIMEEIDKLKDAKEKLDKAKEAKELLDEVKKELAK